MSACNHAVFFALSTIGLLFASKETIGLGIMFPFNFSSQEDARIAIVAPPSMSRSRAKFWLDSSSPIFHPSISTSDSTHLSRTTKSEPYKGIDFDHSNSKTAILDKVAIPVSKCRGASDTKAFTTASREKLVSTSASGSIFKRYSGLGLGAPPTRSRDSTRDDSGASPRWDEDSAILDTPSTSPAPQRISPMASEPKRHPRKQPAGLGLGLPPSIFLRTTSPLVSSPISFGPLGVDMLTSSLSISSDLCRLTSQPPSKLPPSRPQPQPLTRLFSSKIPHLTVSKFTKRLLYTIPESSTSSLFQGHQCAIGKDAGSEGVVRPFGRTLF
ncbi:hypothetical protein EDD85DRAFT_62586 [Armillaria nabsnona]|nr:hypothetical protein EDD85DRAFT_62586 [Armillaria nabsnona]